VKCIMVIFKSVVVYIIIIITDKSIVQAEMLCMPEIESQEPDRVPVNFLLLFTII